MKAQNFASSCPDDAAQYQRADFYMHVMVPLDVARDRQVISVSENHTQAQVAHMDYPSKMEQIISVCTSSLPQAFQLVMRHLIRVSK
jgi:hypothetical protein